MTSTPLGMFAQWGSVVYPNQVRETNLKATTRGLHGEAGQGYGPHGGCLILDNTSDQRVKWRVPGTSVHRVIRYRALTSVVHLTLRTANDGWDKGREPCGMCAAQHSEMIHMQEHTCIDKCLLQMPDLSQLNPTPSHSFKNKPAKSENTPLTRSGEIQSWRAVVLQSSAPILIKTSPDYSVLITLQTLISLFKSVWLGLKQNSAGLRLSRMEVTPLH